MGVVYKAQDTKLDCFIALKFLRPHVSSLGDDNARFLQGAMAATSVMHPDICTIYGGETLGRRIAHDLPPYESVADIF